MTAICVDVMGSDKGPEVVLEGVAQALAADSDLTVLVAGADEYVTPFCEKHEGARPLVTTEVIHMDEHPANAIRTKKDSSIVRASAAVHAGEAEGLCSFGSTGAVLTAATFGIGRIKGIKRPALALPCPGVGGHKTVMLDLGANADVKPEVMVQFAHMGRAYAKVALGTDDPKVGLLSNGSEDTKGSEMALAYHAALAEGNCGFIGNAEGTDILNGMFDVIVTDGFTGNVALKSIEGTAKFLVAQIKEQAGSSKKTAIGALLMKPALKAVASELSGDRYGGAVLLGLRAPVVKGHGSSNAAAVKAATLACAEVVRARLPLEIQQSCSLTNDRVQ